MSDKTLREAVEPLREQLEAASKTTAVIGHWVVMYPQTARDILAALDREPAPDLLPGLREALRLVCWMCRRGDAVESSDEGDFHRLATTAVAHCRAQTIRAEIRKLEDSDGSC